ncbi:MAG: AP endonuclease [Thermodesulfovibrio sp.]|nr:AP endonuclease [Thermodesulfovibrio sp.]
MVQSPHIHIPYHRLSEHLSFIRENRLDLELYFGGSVLDVLTLDAVRELASLLDYGPSLSFHAPFMDLSPGAVDSRVREATMERFRQTLDIADILRPKAIVFHSGYEKWRYGLNMELWLEKSLQTWQPLNKLAVDIGTKIAIENIFEEEPSNLKLLAESMASDNFGICFDTGHFNLFSKSPLEDWIEALRPYIVELHLHDNHGTTDEHLPMGEGQFDFIKFFNLLDDRDCVHTLEAHTQEHVLRSMQYHARITGIITDISSGSAGRNPSGPA